MAWIALLDWLPIMSLIAERGLNPAAKRRRSVSRMRYGFSAERPTASTHLLWVSRSIRGSGNPSGASIATGMSGLSATTPHNLRLAARNAETSSAALICARRLPRHGRPSRRCSGSSTTNASRLSRFWSQFHPPTSQPTEKPSGRLRHSYQPDPPGQKLLHHAVLQRACFVTLDFEHSKLEVKIRKDCRNSDLLQ